MGTNSYLTIPSINLNSSNRLTLEAWIKPINITSSNYSDIIRQQGSGNPDWLLGFQNYGSLLSFGLKTGAGNYQELRAPIDPSSLTDGGWHHIAATYDGTTRIL